MIDARGLSKTYASRYAGTVPAVLDAHVRIHAGEVALLMGPSGSGKTTLLSLLGGLSAPTAGSVQVAGVAVHRLAAAQRDAFRLSRIGFVFQRFRLLAALTAQENVELVVRLAGCNAEAARERAAGLLRRMNVHHRAGHFPPMLSGGEQQRVAIARALANDPPVLLADEPTGSLDSEAGTAVITCLEEAASRGKAVLIATHDVRLRAYAHRVFHMEDGRVSEL